MKKSCSYCGRMHEQSEVCPLKPKREWSRYTEDSEIRRYRKSRDWQGVRERVLKRDLYSCRVCLVERPYITRWYRLEVHHITPLVEDYSLRREPDNLITLCRRHHEDAESGFITRERLMELVKSNPLPLNGN